MFTKHPLKFLGGLLSVTLLLYLASYGPVVGWYLAEGLTPPPIVKAIYSPFDIINNTPFGAVAVRYLHIWITLYGGRVE